MQNLVVVSTKRDLDLLEQANFQVIDVDEYLSKDMAELKRARVFNLCRDYSYCKKGYYVSLIAEARGHRPLPSVSSLMELETKSSKRFVDERVHDMLQKAFRNLKTDDFELSIYFGKNLAERYSALSRVLFQLCPAPLLRAQFNRKDDEWHLRSIKPISLRDVQEAHTDFLISSMNEYFLGSSAGQSHKKKQMRYDLAILINPAEKMPPSNQRTINKFIQAGSRLRIHCEQIESKDMSLLSRFDALFIRETTNVNDHTYQFASRAHNDGLVVIDDPLSIIRCCNKIYLNDLLMRKKIPQPKTQILLKTKDIKDIKLSFPLVVKKPDSSFSTGVKKVDNIDALRIILEEFFQETDLVILQEFLKSDFDWRVGLIDGEPLYVCKYFMARDHWQIINHSSQSEKMGGIETFALSEVPEQLLRLAKKSCEPIGNSLYGVDIKEINGQYYVIEVNDNPNIERGNDHIAGENLYLRVMSSFLRRMEMR